MTEVNPNLRSLFQNYVNQQNYKNLKNISQEEKNKLDLNGDGKVDYKDKKLMDNNEKELLNKNNFDFNNDNRTDIEDLFFIQGGIDIDGDGNISQEELEFIVNYKNQITTEIYTNLKNNKNLTVNDLLNFENIVASMSDADKKTWKTQLQKIENQIITNIKANVDMNADGETNMADILALWNAAKDVSDTKLVNGKKLSDVLVEIQTNMTTAVKKANNLNFDFNNDKEVNVNDILSSDLDGDGKITELEKAFIKNNKSAIYNEILNNVKSNKKVTVNDLLELEKAIASMSEEDKKTWKSYLSNIESNMINNIKKNTDVTNDNHNTKEDLKEFWKMTYNLDEKTVLTNGQKLSSLLSSIESQIMTAITKEDKTIKKADLTSLKKDALEELKKNDGYYNNEIVSIEESENNEETKTQNDIETPTTPTMPAGTEYILDKNLKSIVVNGKEIKLDIGNLNSGAFGKIIVDETGKIYVYINDDAKKYCTLKFETTENLDIELKQSQNDKFVLSGGSGNDKIVVDEGVKLYDVYGRDGNDTIINNGTINDTVYGGNGNDTIVNNGTINDAVRGGNGDDVITNNATIQNYIQGENGNDTIIISEDTVNKNLNVNGDGGDDTIINKGIVSMITGGQGNDKMQNFGETTVMWGDDGNDEIINEATGIVSSGINGDSGDDTIVNRGVVGKEGNGGYIDGSYGNDKVYNEGVAGNIKGGGQTGDIVSDSGISNGDDRVPSNVINEYIDKARELRKEVEKEDSFNEIKNHNILEDFWQWLRKVLGF